MCRPAVYGSCWQEPDAHPYPVLRGDVGIAPYDLKSLRVFPFFESFSPPGLHIFYHFMQSCAIITKKS